MSGNSDSAAENKSIIRAAKIIACLGSGLTTVTDIAAQCKYSTSTVHRFLQTMKELDWAAQDAVNHRYYLGPFFTEVSSNQLANHRYLVVHALEEMTRLTDISAETVNIAIMVQLHYVLLHHIASKLSLKVTEIDHENTPAPFTGATGKVLLAQLSDKEISENLRKVNLAHVTAGNVTDKNEFTNQLAEIRQRGYAVSCGERIAGVICIAAPIGNYTFPAALSVLGPAQRMEPRLAELTEELIASAKRISDNIDGIFSKKGVMRDRI